MKTTEICNNCGHHVSQHANGICGPDDCSCPEFIPLSGEAQTCPRRTGGMGSWDHSENLDVWETNRWNQYHSSYRWPDGFEKPRTCSFCGCAHPEDVIKLMLLGWGSEKSTKGYKGYLHPPGYWEYVAVVVHSVYEKAEFPETTFVEPTPPVKFYVMHFSKDQLAWLDASIRSRGGCKLSV